MANTSAQQTSSHTATIRSSFLWLETISGYTSGRYTCRAGPVIRARRHRESRQGERRQNLLPGRASVNEGRLGAGGAWAFGGRLETATAFRTASRVHESPPSANVVPYNIPLGYDAPILRSETSIADDRKRAAGLDDERQQHDVTEENDD